MLLCLGLDEKKTVTCNRLQTELLYMLHAYLFTTYAKKLAYTACEMYTRVHACVRACVRAHEMHDDDHNN
jgi:hypothetical protein